MQQLKVPAKFMTYIPLFRSDCGYYLHFINIHVPWILSTFSEYHGYICISWILFVLVTLRAT